MKRRGSSSLLRPAVMEKQRRDHMKELYSTLASLLSLQSYDKMPLPVLLDQATISLKQLKERVDQLTGEKEELKNEYGSVISSNEHKLDEMVQVSEKDSWLEVTVVVRANYKRVKLFRVLHIIEQGGAVIQSYSFSCQGHTTHYTIHAQALPTRLGFVNSQIECNLKQLFCQ